MVTPLLPEAPPADAETLTELPSADELVANTYAQLRAIAAGHFAGQLPSHTLQPTALVHEAIMKVIRDPRRADSAGANAVGGAGAGVGRWNSREHFLAVAATAMRQILIDHARAKATQKRTGAPRPPRAAGAESFATTFLELNEAIDALGRLDPRAAQGVMLRFFTGLTIPQTAQVQGVSEFTVERDWRAARAFLAQQLAGSPAHEGALS